MKKIDPKKLKEKKVREKEEKEEVKEVSISAGSVGERIVDYMFNPIREKMPEVTILDRLQGRLFPLLHLVRIGQRHTLETAHFRQNKELYKKMFKKECPITPDDLDELMYSTYQHGKSIAGKNLERGMDLALADIESRAVEEEDKLGGEDMWGEK